MISFSWAYADTFFITLTLIGLALFFKLWKKNKKILHHSLTSWYHAQTKNIHAPLWIIRALRTVALVALACLIARPQLIDHRSEVTVDGIDIMLCLDVSGSMEFFDDLQDRRSRITVAKQEAITFIDRRHHDPIGIVVFGADALTLCPLTLDKPLLKNFISTTNIGIVNPNGTKLFTGLATALGRLRKSTAKSKIIVVLTDGKPMGETKFDADTIIAMAKEFGVTIYSIGIGNQQGGYVFNAFGSIQAIGAESIDYVLLATLARETGGKFYPAHNPEEMKIAYDAIDRLAKTTYETKLFSLHHEKHMPFLLLFLIAFFGEIFLRCFIFKGFFS